MHFVAVFRILISHIELAVSDLSLRRDDVKYFELKEYGAKNFSDQNDYLSELNSTMYKVFLEA